MKATSSLNEHCESGPAHMQRLSREEVKLCQENAKPDKEEWSVCGEEHGKGRW